MFTVFNDTEWNSNSNVSRRFNPYSKSNNSTLTVYNWQLTDTTVDCMVSDCRQIHVVGERPVDKQYQKRWFIWINQCHLVMIMIKYNYSFGGNKQSGLGLDSDWLSLSLAPIVYIMKSTLTELCPGRSLFFIGLLDKCINKSFISTYHHLFHFLFFSFTKRGLLTESVPEGLSLKVCLDDQGLKDHGLKPALLYLLCKTAMFCGLKRWL